MEVNEQQETAETTAGAVSEPVPSGMQNLAELLSTGEEAIAKQQAKDSGESTYSEPGGSQETAELTEFNALADKLGVDLDTLYKLQVKTSDSGEPVTIEELKDLHKKRDEIELGKIEFEEHRVEQEQELMRTRAELTELMQALPKNAVKPETLERIRRKSEEHTKRERALTLDVIPEWKDAKRREADIAAMSEHLQGYGFPVNYLESVVSHQLVKYFRDAWQREERIREALKRVKPGTPPKSTTSKQTGKSPSKNALNSIKRGSARNKLEAVFSTVSD